jgi:uncharacterized protein YjeT (DUF2065 family)
MAAQETAGNETESDERQKRKLRRLGVGAAVSGLLVVVAVQVFPDPTDILVGGLGFVGIALLVFEYTEGVEGGFSLGFITSGLIVWLHPILAGESEYTFTGILLILLGIINFVFPPFALFFQNIGKRMARDSSDKAKDNSGD